MKIVITGGLGYIGTELCKLYSGETRYKQIVVTDNRFVSERVKQLRDWGFQFINTSILDKEKIGNVVKDADVVIHSTGITDIAYTKTQADIEKDKLNEKLPHIIVVMAWNFFEDIKRNNQDLIDKGVKFISIKDLQND